jgi:hypothetical protein
MTDEDDEFNRIEREAKQRMEAVKATVSQHMPMHPEIKKMYEDYFDKCFRESSTAQRTWTGLSDDERRAVRNSVAYNQFMTAGEYAELVQKATESLLKAKNEM